MLRTQANAFKDARSSGPHAQRHLFFCMGIPDFQESAKDETRASGAISATDSLQSTSNHDLLIADHSSGRTRCTEKARNSGGQCKRSYEVTLFINVSFLTLGLWLTINALRGEIGSLARGRLNKKLQSADPWGSARAVPLIRAAKLKVGYVTKREDESPQGKSSSPGRVKAGCVELTRPILSAIPIVDFLSRLVFCVSVAFLNFALELIAASVDGRKVVVS